MRQRRRSRSDAQPQAARREQPRRLQRPAKLAPAAKRMVEEHKLDAGQIAGSGRDGRISKGDVIQHMAGKDAAPAQAAAKPAPAVQAAVADRRTHRAARADDAPARAHRRAPDAGAIDCRDADDVQRGRPDGGQRDPRALQGQVREDARREARLHVVLRQGVDRGAAHASRPSMPRSTATTSSITSSTTSASRSRPTAA